MPYSGQNWLIKVIIGSALCTIAALAGSRHDGFGQLVHAVLGLFTVGYAIRVMSAETNNAAGALPATLPVWADPLKLLKDGLVITLANALYGFIFAMFVFAVSALLGVTGTVAAAVTQGSAAALAGAGMVWMVVVGIAGLAYGLVMPMVAAHYAHEQRFGALVEFGTAFGKLTGKPLNVLLAIVGSVLVGILAVLLTFTIVGIPFAAFLAQVTLANIWAQVYRLA